MSNNTELPARMTSRSKPVRVLGSVAAGSAALAGGLPMLTPDRYDWIGPAFGLLGIVLSVALTKWTEDQTTPWDDVAAKVTPSGKVVAGPASSIPTGATVEVVNEGFGDGGPSQPEGYRGETGL